MRPPKVPVTCPETAICGPRGDTVDWSVERDDRAGIRVDEEQDPYVRRPCESRATTRRLCVRCSPSVATRKAKVPSVLTVTSPPRSVPAMLQARVPAGSATLPRTSTTGARSLMSAGLVIVSGWFSAPPTTAISSSRGAKRVLTAERT